MISDRDKATITTLARRYNAAAVWLFGSNTDRRKRGRDLDLAVEGVAPAQFFRFVGELMLSLSKPVDVVTLERRSKLSALIRREGKRIYACFKKEAKRFVQAQAERRGSSKRSGWMGMRRKSGPSAGSLE